MGPRWSSSFSLSGARPGSLKAEPQRPGVISIGGPERVARWNTCRVIRRAGRPRYGSGDRHFESHPQRPPPSTNALRRS